jgi:myo-inositol 2-dehydrogenase/D-chiro-inositol 1-dehydrogenase
VITGLTRDGVAIVADIFANNSYGYDVRCEITCESGVVSVGVWGEVQVVKNHEQPGRSSVTLGDNWIPRYRDAYIAELVAWTGTLRGEPAPDLATVQDGFHAMEVLDRVLST